MLFTLSKSDLKLLIYDKKIKIIVSRDISRRLADGKLVLVDLVWLNKASIPNFSALGSPEVAESLLSRVGVVITWFKAKSQIKLD